ncbi:hypothetical protein [Aquiflexum sp.]|uniref:Spy/CpxP family protein refolding chaperone n=1 Tax=Aquiflexum sp. TaxID=1872584 RepID=UPI0035937331
MKNLILVFLMLFIGTAQAQDIFQEALYSGDLIMKNREKIALSDQQAEKIKKIHSQNAGEFSTLKWDLDEANAKLKSLLKEPKINQEAAIRQLEIVLAIENNLKKKQLSNLVSIKNELNENQIEQLGKLKNNRVFGSTSLKSAQKTDAPVAISVMGSTSAENKPAMYYSNNGKLIKIKDIESIKPEDIQSIEVLKNKAAIDKVGEEGKNGVVILIMKKGSND